MTKQWVPGVEDRIEELRNEVLRLRHITPLPSGTTNTTGLLDEVDRELHGLDGAVRANPVPSPERVWSTLHSLEEDLDLLRDDQVLTERAREHALSSLAPADARRAVKALDSAQPAAAPAPPTPPASTPPLRGQLSPRVQAQSIIHASHSAAAQVHASERNWFRGVTVTAAMLLIASALLLGYELLFDVGLLTVEVPSDATAPLPATLLGLTMLAGAMGALVSGAIAIYVNRRPAQDNTYWFDPNRRLLLLKVALGPVIAVAGVALLIATEVVAVFPSTVALFFTAFVLGYSQQLVTRRLEGHADDLLTGKTASTSATGAAGKPSGSAT